MKATIIFITLILSILAVPAALAETLTVLERRYHAMDNLTGCLILAAVRLGGDTLIHASSRGVFLQPDISQPWEKVIDCLGPDEVSYSRRCYSRKKLKQLVWPEGLWYIQETNEILAFDGYCDCLYSIHLAGGHDSYVELWSKRVKNDYFHTVNIQGSHILCGSPRFTGDKALVIQSTNKSRYDRVFAYPASLAQRLDSVGVGTGSAFCYPALNPHDSTLWIAIYGYDFIYITDMQGYIQDSLLIDAPDYKLPPQIRSRIKSRAVSVEWLSQWTQIRSFHYVDPGHFLLRYEIGDVGETASRSRSTVAWKANSEQIPLEVTKGWRLVGVEPNGEIIFACYESDSEQSGIALYITRIQP